MRFFRLAMTAAGIAMAGFSLSASAQEGGGGIQKNFGQWRVECNPKMKESPCVLAFALVHPKDKKIAFAWSIVPGKEPNTQKAVVRTLNGTRLADGISVKFAKGDPLKIAYYTCGPRFCFAEFPFSDSWLKTFKAQKGFEVSYVAVDGKPIKHEISLDQFTQAFEFYTSNLAKTN
ncbi:MAG: invasion associated locus B family protein [Rhizobiales bacterium]|nr:invasion associated locus B family protein [Hyphomicrobiales bacterium]